MATGKLVQATAIMVVCNSHFPPGKALVDADGHIWHLDWNRSTEGFWCYVDRERVLGQFVAVTKDDKRL